jgi:AcrR family transcriptional regulator
MVQIKKQKIKNLIDNSALDVFIEKGYRNTKISDIAIKAGISVGNIYRYYKGKEDIFNSIISEDFVNQFKQYLTQKITAWQHNDETTNAQNRNNLIDFLIENKKSFIMLTKSCKGTKFEYLVEYFVDFLVDTFFSNNNTQKDNYYQMFRMFYKKYIEVISDILCCSENKEEIKELINVSNQYHMFGITSFIIKK